MMGSMQMIAVDAQGRTLASATRIGGVCDVNIEDPHWAILFAHLDRPPLRTTHQVSALRAIRGVPGCVDVVHVRDSPESPQGAGTVGR